MLLSHCTLSGKKDQNIFCNIFYKTWVILMKFGRVSSINVLQIYSFPPHFNNVSTLPCVSGHTVVMVRCYYYYLYCRQFRTSIMCLCACVWSDEEVRIPSFDGTSFLRFVGLQRRVLSYTDIEMIIKPTSQNGLVFYNGYVKGPTGDFISLALKDGFVEFRFDLGTGPAYILYVFVVPRLSTYDAPGCFVY